MRFLLPFIVLALSFKAAAQTPETGYRLYDTKTGKEVGLGEIAARMQPGQVLVYGEQHDDSIGHLLEKEVLEALYARQGKRVILAMEMFHRDVQYILDEYLEGLISEKNFVKEARAWETYSTDYRPSVEFAREKGLRVIAANAPSRYTNMVTRKGLDALYALDKDTRKQYIAPLPIDTVSGPYYDNFLEAMGGHTMPGMHLFQSQNFWDATMAWSVAEALRKQKQAVVLMFNGRFHSDHHLGMVRRLERDYKKTVVTISSFSVASPGQPGWEQYRELADYVFLTQAPAAKP